MDALLLVVFFCRCFDLAVAALVAVHADDRAQPPARFGAIHA